MSEAVKERYPNGRCRVAVYHRDTYRYTGRTKSGFEMHHTKKQCKRAAKANGRCSQHADKPWLTEVEWAE